jgi:hypothetical protein
MDWHKTNMASGGNKMISVVLFNDQCGAVWFMICNASGNDNDSHLSTNDNKSE